MNKNSIFICMAVLPLLVVACAKNTLLENEEPSERATMIDPWTAIDQTQYKAPLIPGPNVTIPVEFEETKATMEVGTSSAKVVWEAGDSFMMYAWESGSYHEISFSTTGSGDRVDFTTPYVTPSVTPWHDIYGATVNHVGYDGDMFFGLNIPVTQNAVAGTVKKDYLYSYAKATEGESSKLCFKSMLAFVRFKMSGAIASSVKSVTLRGGSALAGDCVMVPANDGTPQVTFSKAFDGDVASPTVTLSGSFAADTYYYFAVAPGTQTSFSLTFAGATGTTTKIATKTVTFARGQINDIGTIALGDTFTDPDTPSMASIKYMSATATGTTKPVTIAVIPDGFQADEMSKYEMLAKSAINTLFNVEPFKSYKTYFNVYILKKASNASGARITDGTPAEQTRDCYFESSWAKNSYNNMTANETKIREFVTDNCPDIGTETGKHPIEEVPILMIINDSRYGGICHTSSSGFGYCMAPYTYNGGGITWSYPSKEAVSDSNPSEGYQDTPADRFTEVGANVGNWLNTMVHEFGGHCFSRLADEYWNGITDKGSASYIEGHRWDSSYSGVPYGLNVSATYTNPGYDNPNQGEAYIKQGWQHLLDKRASLPNTDIRKTRIGVYQGGDVSILHRWRSERISCMIDNRFYFSTFQRELIVKRIMSLAGASFDFNTFWANDVAVDPVRDVISSQVMGETDPVEPRPMPLLPPPVFHMDW